MLSEAPTRSIPLLPTTWAITTTDAAALALAVADGDADVDGDELDALDAGCEPQAASMSADATVPTMARTDENRSMMTSSKSLGRLTGERY
jgi:hypothetical protein